MNGIFANYLGKLYDWGSVSMTILGSLQIGVNKINIDYGRESTDQYGYGQQPIGYINKNFVYKANLGLLYDQVQQITVAASAQGLSMMEIPPFQINLILGSTQDPAVPFKSLTLQNCRFTTDNLNMKQNDGGFYHDYPIAYSGLIAGF